MENRILTHEDYRIKVLKNYKDPIIFFFEDERIDLNYEEYKKSILQVRKLVRFLYKLFEGFNIDEKEWDTKLLLNKNPIIRKLYLSYLELFYIHEELEEIRIV